MVTCLSSRDCFCKLDAMFVKLALNEVRPHWRAKRTFIKPAQVTFKRLCVALASVIPRLPGPDCNYISSFYPAEASESLWFPLVPARWHTALTWLSEVSSCRSAKVTDSIDTADCEWQVDLCYIRKGTLLKWASMLVISLWAGKEDLSPNPKQTSPALPEASEEWRS